MRMLLKRCVSDSFCGITKKPQDMIKGRKLSELEKQNSVACLQFHFLLGQ